MKNEIERKITSLTLMTIMVAGGLTFAVPGVMPAAYAANANLFVSAENSQFDNHMSGPQVIEVVVKDSDIDETDRDQGEPDVTINGADLTMVQSTDGNWYGYFADREHAQIADGTVKNMKPGTGLDFGTFCAKDNLRSITGVDFDDTTGVAFSSFNGASGTNGVTESLGECTSDDLDDTDDPNNLNVVRESKRINQRGTDNWGQVSLKTGFQHLWPFIQLYDLNPTGNVVIKYNKAGGVQSTTLTFDTVDNYTGLKLDRESYPPDAEVHVTISDPWLNMDPTDEDSWTFAADGTGTWYQLFNDAGGSPGYAVDKNGTANINPHLSSLMTDENGFLKLNPQVSGNTPIVEIQSNQDSNSTRAVDYTGSDYAVTITETTKSSGVFVTYDSNDYSTIKITSDAPRDRSASIDYDGAQSILVSYSNAAVDIQPPTEEWSSGEEIPIAVVDADENINSRSIQYIRVSEPASIIPSLQTGDPFTLHDGTGPKFLTISGSSVISSSIADSTFTAADDLYGSITVEDVSKRGLIDVASDRTVDTLVIDLGANLGDLKESINDAHKADKDSDFQGINLLNFDLRSFGTSNVDVWLLLDQDGTIISDGSINSPAIKIDDNKNIQSLIGLNHIGNTEIKKELNQAVFNKTVNPDNTAVGLLFEFKNQIEIEQGDVLPFVVDFFSFGFENEGKSSSERIANQLIRLELEESTDDSGIFTGTLEYTMLNQLNILASETYENLVTINKEATFIVIEDLTDEDSIRVNYLDKDINGDEKQQSDQEAAPSHSGVVSFDQATYKQGDTVVVELDDLDLNLDGDLKDVYTTVSIDNDPAIDQVGEAGLGDLGVLLNITFDDELWIGGKYTYPAEDGISCAEDNPPSRDGLASISFSMVETDKASGKFKGSFQIPSEYCQRTGSSPGNMVSTTGTDIEVNYIDFRDSSGEIIEVGDSSGIRANTGSVSLDRTVYPVPWGDVKNFATDDDLGSNTPDKSAVFPFHSSAFDGNINGDDTLGDGVLTIHVRVNDPDFDLSASGEDVIASDIPGTDRGPLKITISRGAEKVVLAYAGGDAKETGVIDVDDTAKTVKDGANKGKLLGSNDKQIRLLGPIDEIDRDAGIFELDFDIRYTDGPASSLCPDTEDDVGYNVLMGDGKYGNSTTRFDKPAPDGEDYCILQGDIITVEYTDPTDSSGSPNTVTDSATFDLRNGVLQTDKSVYIIGGDMIITIIEPDWDLDNDAAETYDLDVIEWDSDAATISMGDHGGEAAAFDPEPTDLRETGDSTGIFQVVVEIPQSLKGETLERGEEIVLEYTDWGPSGSNYVGQEDEDIDTTVFTSNFGATVELDQKVYSWTDKVYITIVAPDHNFDSDLIDEIGNTSDDPIKITTRGHELDQYKLVETGTDTGIFTGEVILTGFKHNADGKVETGDADGSDTNPRNGNSAGETTNLGPTDGFLRTNEDGGITVSFEFSEDETVVGSALIRWNIGEVQWLEPSYPASGTGVLRVIDPDMNLDPEAVDNFDVEVSSDSDAGGIDLTVTETSESTGIFEGTVFFTVNQPSSGHRLRVSEGDTITGEYRDNTLPDPHTTADEMRIKSTSLIGTIVPPLEKAPATSLRIVDNFGNTLDNVSVDQQVQITADLANGQDKDQPFTYIVQVQDGNGVTVKLDWIDGDLAPEQAFSPSASWVPSSPGTYTAEVFVWESVNNPTALSPPIQLTITVS